jgi:hypothetical protein
MSRVDSNYERKDRDLYETPAWVTQALIWEPACGNGAIVRVLADNGYHVHATDKVDGEDFFATNDSHGSDGIVTNPPYTDSAVFVQHAIDLMMPRSGYVAMLLPIDYDSAKSRRELFADCPVFAGKIVLLRRIVWFERDDGKRAQPSENHAWYLWSWTPHGRPTIRYAP